MIFIMSAFLLSLLSLNYFSFFSASTISDLVAAAISSPLFPSLSCPHSCFCFFLPFNSFLINFGSLNSPIPFFFCHPFLCPCSCYGSNKSKKVGISCVPASKDRRNKLPIVTIFIICTIETLVHYSKHLLYTEKNGTSQSPKWLQYNRCTAFFPFYIYICNFFL